MPEYRSRIVCVGDVIDDVVAIPLGAIRDDTDTVSSISFRAGGSAANTAAWLGTLGADVDFFGAVNTGDLTRHAELLEGCGVATHLRGQELLPTGTIVVIVAGEQRTMLTDRGANVRLDPDWITDELLAETAVLHVTGHTLLNEAGAGGIAALIARANEHGVLVSLAPGSAGFVADYGVDEFLAASSGGDILFPSLEEGALLTGRQTPELIIAALGESFPTVVLTMGAAGVAVFHDGLTTLVPADEALVVDPTGAGDAFCAGYLDEWVRSGDRVAAARAGAGVASRAVAIIGGRPDA
ncbi:MAG: PfkB family carbohydrate kinase [Rhodoglobus sp.]